MNENIAFTYSNNETNESVWPGKSVSFKIAIYSSNYVLSTLWNIESDWTLEQHEKMSNKAIMNTSYTYIPAVGILYDGVPREDLVTVHISITVIIIFLSFCGIILTIACLVFNFVFRMQK